MPIIESRLILVMTDTNILEHIAHIQLTLKRGRLKPAQAVLADHMLFAHASLSDFLERVFVSDPTILRF